MTPEQFCYWLQGLFEISNPTTLGELEVQIIKDHLSIVFEKITPDRNEVEDELPQAKRTDHNHQQLELDEKFKQEFLKLREDVERYKNKVTREKVLHPAGYPSWNRPIC